MRIDKFLSNLGYGSRNDIKKIIRQKRVSVNETIITKSDIKINPEQDDIVLDGEKIFYEQFVYLMLNKPSDVISATKDNMHETVIDILEEKYQRLSLFPCGRLDRDTEGLLILSNDGDFAHRITHPNKQVYKRYFVKVDGVLSVEDVATFKEGMELLDGANKPYKTAPATLEILEDQQSAYVSIKEGKFHQVKRMFKNVGKTVNYLKRVSVGNLTLDEGLELGEYRPLTDEELNQILNK